MRDLPEDNFSWDATVAVDKRKIQNGHDHAQSLIVQLTINLKTKLLEFCKKLTKRDKSTKQNSPRKAPHQGNSTSNCSRAWN